MLGDWFSENDRFGVPTTNWESSANRCKIGTRKSDVTMQLKGSTNDENGAMIGASSIRMGAGKRYGNDTRFDVVPGRQQ